MSTFTLPHFHFFFAGLLYHLVSSRRPANLQPSCPHGAHGPSIAFAHTNIATAPGWPGLKLIAERYSFRIRYTWRYVLSAALDSFPSRGFPILDASTASSLDYCKSTYVYFAWGTLAECDASRFINRATAHNRVGSSYLRLIYAQLSTSFMQQSLKLLIS